MCEIRLNVNDNELRVRIDTFIANIHRLRNQLRNQPGLQFMDKTWFPRISNRAFDQWKDVLSRDVALLHNCASVDDLMEMLWNIKDSNRLVGIGEATVHRTAEILANLWDSLLSFFGVSRDTGRGYGFESSVLCELSFAIYGKVARFN